MVVIKEKPLEERVAEEKYRKLAKLASDLFGAEHVREALPPDYFSIYGAGKIVVLPRSLKIIVGHSAYFDKAVTLAETCERETSSEFTVQKDY